jgi:hypothetical protein
LGTDERRYLVMLGKLKCKDCPRFKDSGHTDHEGNHFGICGMGGNMVYPEERKVKRVSGRGYIHYQTDGCGLYDTVEQALANMTESAVRRYKERMQGNDGNGVDSGQST